MTLDLDLRRRFFAEELEAVARLRSTRLVDAFAAVPRERFLPPAAAGIAYLDTDISVSARRRLLAGVVGNSVARASQARGKSGHEHDGRGRNGGAHGPAAA